MTDSQPQKGWLILILSTLEDCITPVPEEDKVIDIYVVGPKNAIC